MDIEEQSMHTPSALETMAKEDLSDASLDELSERITVLKSEIERVNGVMHAKKNSHKAAEDVFK